MDIVRSQSRLERAEQRALAALERPRQRLCGGGVVGGGGATGGGGPPGGAPGGGDESGDIDERRRSGCGEAPGEPRPMRPISVPWTEPRRIERRATFQPGCGGDGLRRPSLDVRSPCGAAGANVEPGGGSRSLRASTAATVETDASLIFCWSFSSCESKFLRSSAADASTAPRTSSICARSAACSPTARRSSTVSSRWSQRGKTSAWRGWRKSGGSQRSQQRRRSVVSRNGLIGASEGAIGASFLNISRSCSKIILARSNCATSSEFSATRACESDMIAMSRLRSTICTIIIMIS